MSVCTWEVGRPWLCSETTVAPRGLRQSRTFFPSHFLFSYLSPLFSRTLSLSLPLSFSLSPLDSVSVQAAPLGLASRRLATRRTQSKIFLAAQRRTQRPIRRLCLID